MTRVLMVCLGNICRSPLAEGIFKSKVDPENFFVDSAGTGSYHVGELPDPRSIEIARHHQIDITDQRARQFKVQDFDEFDMILVMDQSNYYNVMRLARNEDDKSKVSLILDVLNQSTNEVPDPYYGGANGFKLVFDMLDQACEEILSKF